MIHVNEIVTSTHLHGSDDPRVSVRRLVVAVRDLRRSAAFYRWTFGFRPCSAAPASPRRSMLIAANGRTDLCLRDQRAAPLPAGLLVRSWAFVVTDLDDVRERVWEHGIPIARDSGEPDHIFRRPSCASLYVLDPDENEIELVQFRSERPQPAFALPEAARQILERGAWRCPARSSP